MDKINFQNGITPLNDTNLNKMQANVEKAIEEKHKYSTEEQVIGTWTNRKPLYRKVLPVSSFPNNTTINYYINLNIDTIVNISGFATNGSVTLPINNSDPLDNSKAIGVYSYNKTELNIVTVSNRSSYSGYIILEYTKTTDA